MKIYLEGGPMQGELPLDAGMQAAVCSGFLRIDFYGWYAYRRTGRTRGGLRVYRYES